MKEQIGSLSSDGCSTGFLYTDAPIGWLVWLTRPDSFSHSLFVDANVWSFFHDLPEASYIFEVGNIMTLVMRD